VLLPLLAVLPLPDFWITQLNYIGLYSLVALGLVLLTGVGGLTSFGQAAFVGIGAYTSAYMTVNLGWSPWATIFVGMAICAVSALLVGWLTLRMSGHYLPLATIAWGLSLYYLMGNLEALGKYDGILGVPTLSLFGWDLGEGRPFFLLVWAMVLFGAFALINLLDSRTGRAIRALKSATQMAEAMGVNTLQHKVGIFLIAANYACVSGWLFAHFQRTVNPSPFSLKFGIEYLFMAVLGGVGHVWGAITGAAVHQDHGRPAAGAVAQAHRHQRQLRGDCVRHRAGAGAQVPARWRVEHRRAGISRCLSASTIGSTPSRCPSAANPPWAMWCWMCRRCASSSAAWWLSMTSASRSRPADRRSDWPQRRRQIHHLQPGDGCAER
jgi:ABC-type branched-subunit amino acid transport system permease subunit